MFTVMRKNVHSYHEAPGDPKLPRRNEEKLIFSLSQIFCDRGNLAIHFIFFLQYIFVKYLFFARICRRNRNIGITKTQDYIQEVLMVQCTRRYSIISSICKV